MSCSWSIRRKVTRGYVILALKSNSPDRGILLFRRERWSHGRKKNKMWSVLRCSFLSISASNSASIVWRLSTFRGGILTQSAIAVSFVPAWIGFFKIVQYAQKDIFRSNCIDIFWKNTYLWCLLNIIFFSVLLRWFL